MKLDNDLLQLVLIIVAVNYPSVNLEIRSFWFSLLEIYRESEQD